MHPIMIRQMQQVVLFGLMQPVVLRPSRVHECAPAFPVHQLFQKTSPVLAACRPYRCRYDVRVPTIDVPADPA